MGFPLSPTDISLGFAAMVIILLITSGLLSSSVEYSRKIVIEKRRLERKLVFPLSPTDISLWFAAMAIILLITSELLSSSVEYSRKIVIEKKRLRLAALALGVCFMISVIARVVQS